MSDSEAFGPNKKQGFWARTLAEAKKATEESRDRQVQARDQAGNLVTKQRFGGVAIEVYDKGYVRVATAITQSTPYEKLRSIKHSYQVQDKSAGGRALMGFATAGANYLASKEKRTVFLTLVTDKRVHSLQATGGMGRSEDKAALGIEAAGQGVLAALAAAPSASTVAPLPAKEQVDLIDQIKRLADLHAAGILSDEEFAAKKTSLLNQI